MKPDKNNIFEKIDKNKIIVGVLALVIIFFGYLYYENLQPAELYISPGDTVYASPGQSLTYDIALYNQYAKTYDFIATGTINGKVVDESDYVMDIKPGDWGYTTLSFNAPVTPGTYTLTVASYYGSAYEFMDDDQSFGVTLIVSGSATPTATPTAKPTATPTAKPTATPTPNACQGIICNDYCVGTTLYNSGVCNNGQCDYNKEYNSPTCGYVAPTATPTTGPTATPTASPTATIPPPSTGISDNLLYGAILVFGAIMFVIYITMRKPPKGKR